MTEIRFTGNFYHWLINFEKLIIRKGYVNPETDEAEIYQRMYHREISKTQKEEYSVYEWSTGLWSNWKKMVKA